MVFLWSTLEVTGMAKTIQINGRDCTEWFKEKGYSVGEMMITGSNSGVTLAGTREEDIIAVKDTLSLPLEPLSEADTHALMTLIRDDQNAPYTEIYYYSVNYGTYRTALFTRDEMTNNHMFTSNFGVDYYQEATLNFTEK